jgi:hypothetical protein
MAEEKQQTAVKAVAEVLAKKAELVRPKDGMAFFYANHFQLGQSSSDVRIVFGEITNVTDQAVEVTQRAQVTVAWLQAKVLAEFLTAHIRLFEERNGPIQTDFAPLINAPPPSIPRVIEPKS